LFSKKWGSVFLLSQNLVIKEPEFRYQEAA
jgi:hypothetical protein